MSEAIEGEIVGRSRAERFHDAEARIHRMTRIMDDVARVPGTDQRFGLDPIIGLIPIVGDVAGALVGGWIVLEATRFGIPRIAVAPEADVQQAWERISLRAGTDDDVLVVFEGRPEAPEIEIDLPVSAALVRPDGSTLALAGRDYVVLEVRGRPFRVSAQSFFQVNTLAAGLLVGLVLDGLALTGGEAVLDLFSGVGLFSAFIAPLAGRVVGAIRVFVPGSRVGSAGCSGARAASSPCGPPSRGRSSPSPRGAPRSPRRCTPAA